METQTTNIPENSIKMSIDPEKSTEIQVEKLEIVFTNGAYYKLKELASFLDLPEERMKDVLVKAMKLLDLAQNNSIIVETKEGKKYLIDVKNL